jgi:hypothetical protein
LGYGNNKKNNKNSVLKVKIWKGEGLHVSERRMGIMSELTIFFNIFDYRCYIITEEMS